MRKVPKTENTGRDGLLCWDTAYQTRKGASLPSLCLPIDGQTGPTSKNNPFRNRAAYAVSSKTKVTNEFTL
jgi:hypothetical protein